MVLLTVFMAAISSGIAGGGSGSSGSSGSGSNISSGSGVTSKPLSLPNLCFASPSRGSLASLASSFSTRRLHTTTTICQCRMRRLPPPESGYYGVLSWRGARKRRTAVSCSSSSETGTSTAAAPAVAVVAAAAAAAEGSGTLEEAETNSPALPVQGVPIKGEIYECVDGGVDLAAGLANTGAVKT